MPVIFITGQMKVRASGWPRIKPFGKIISAESAEDLAEKLRQERVNYDAYELSQMDCKELSREDLSGLLIHARPEGEMQ